jgi:hypothetical protein
MQVKTQKQVMTLQNKAQKVADKLHDEMDFNSASSLRQQFAGRHVTHSDTLF